MTTVTVKLEDGSEASPELQEFADWTLEKIVPMLEAKNNKDMDAFYHAFAALSAILVARNGLAPQEIAEFAFDRASAQQEFQNETRGDLN